MSDPSTEDVYPTPEKHVERAEDFITAAEGPDGPACDFGRYRRLAELHLRAAEVKHALREWRKTWRTESPEIGPELKPVGKISIAPRGGVVGGVRLPEHATAIVYGDPQTVELACHKLGVHWAEASTAAYEGFRFGDGRVVSWAAEHAHEDAEQRASAWCTVSAWTWAGERRCLLDAGHASKHVADVDGRPVRW